MSGDVAPGRPRLGRPQPMKRVNIYAGWYYDRPLSSHWIWR